MVVKFLGDLERSVGTQKQVATNPVMISSVALDSWGGGAIWVHTEYSVCGEGEW